MEAMDIRIECVAGAPPTWKVFLGEFFWSCDTQEEAENWAAKAQAHELMNPAYRLPSPFPARHPRNDDHPRINEKRSCKELIAKKSQQVQ